MTVPIYERYPIIDVDTHLTEPPDIWTDRVSSKWGDLVPHVAPDPRNGKLRWYVGDHRLQPVAGSATAGWTEYPPAHPPTLEEADHGSWDASARLERMDDFGIYANVLYPNVLGFHAHVLLDKDPAFRLECIRAYNDFLIEWTSVDRNRLIPIAMMPFWDTDACVAEIERVGELGFPGILWSADFTKLGFPDVDDPHWDNVYAAAQAHEMSMNFHIGFSVKTAEDMSKMQRKTKDDKSGYVYDSSLMFLGNAQTVAKIILTGLCERYPQLKWVSVESGAGWIPFILSSMDWQWKGTGAHLEYPNRLLPSEYFQRQIYGSFWFEDVLIEEVLELYPDNIMFETDYPHPTSLSPGPASPAEHPKVVVEKNLAGLKDETMRKVLHDTAAKLYKVNTPMTASTAR